VEDASCVFDQADVLLVLGLKVLALELELDPCRLRSTSRRPGFRDQIL
jgi:hypothetical protein